MEIVLFGGAFDPPHLGHLEITTHLLQTAIADEVWLVPVGEHDFDKAMIQAEHRVKMLELLEGNLPRELQNKVRVETCEIERQGVSHTYETLTQLSEQYPEHRFSWLIGADNLAKFHLWKDFKLMLSKFLFYVYPRQDYSMLPLYTGMVPLSGVKQINVSSTEVRNRARAGKSIEELVLPEIEDYIKKQQLYTKFE